MNFLPGDLAEAAGEVCFRFREQTPLPLDVRPDRLGPVDLGIRPSEIQVLREPPRGGSLRGRIERILPTGAKQIMEINVSRTMVLVKVPRDLSYQRGEEVYLLPAQEKICLFDPQEKTRIHSGKGGCLNG